MAEVHYDGPHHRTPVVVTWMRGSVAEEDSWRSKTHRIRADRLVQGYISNTYIHMEQKKLSLWLSNKLKTKTKIDTEKVSQVLSLYLLDIVTCIPTTIINYAS